MNTEKKPGEKYYRYFVEHHDDHTNEVLAENIGSQYECSPQKLWTGRVAPMWEVPGRRFVNFLNKSKQSKNLDFDAFIQEDDKPLRPYPWPIPKKKEPHRKRKAA